MHSPLDLLPRAPAPARAPAPFSDSLAGAFVPAGEGHGLRQSELLGALSRALDLTEGQPPGHSQRAAWIAARLGAVLGSPEDERRDLFHATLLKDLGCSSTAARICQVFVTDDQDFKRRMRLVDLESRGEALPFLLRQAGSAGGLPARWRAWRNLLREGEGLGRELTTLRCERGADIARLLRFPDAVAQGIRCLDERFDGRGRPEGLMGLHIPFEARVAAVAQALEIHASQRGPAEAAAMLHARRGTWFDPEVVDAALALAADDQFWERFGQADLEDEILAMDEAGGEHRVDDEALDDITEAFGRIVDAKSPYTAGHSTRVGQVAQVLGRRAGLDPDRVRWLRRGALLHDIGKLGVSNAILDKPGPLDAAEWDTMRRHAAWTEEILGRITAFRVLSRIAGAHHERLDGNGYPRGLDARHLRLETRIVTVADVFDALTADRPYRAAMPVGRAMDILRADIGTAFDGDVVRTLADAIDAGELRVAPGG